MGFRFHITLKKIVNSSTNLKVMLFLLRFQVVAYNSWKKKVVAYLFFLAIQNSLHIKGVVHN